MSEQRGIKSCGALLEVIPITPSTLSHSESLYEAFRTVCEVEYGWPLKAIDFAGFQRLIQAKMMQGYFLYDVAEDKNKGFFLYQIEAYGALEIKVIYLQADVSMKSALDLFFSRFLEDAKTWPHWEVLSYPLLGTQQKEYINYITWYGFKPVGQAIVAFNMMDGISVEIFKKQQYAALPEGYVFVPWDPQYEASVGHVIEEAFAKSADALWDPRFRSAEGVAEILQFLQTGGYGVFMPLLTTVLLNAERVAVGVCFLNQVGPQEANIPLIGLLESERQHHLGRALLAQTIHKCIESVIGGRSMVTRITATVATGNLPAIRMYRYTAFQEEQWYPHVYQNYADVLKWKAGQWCPP